MSNTKEQRAQKRAIIAASIQERTHRAISVKMPIAFADRLKAEAKENNKIFTGYVLEKIKQGLEASRD
jgi:predicted DNA-binding protein